VAGSATPDRSNPELEEAELSLRRLAAIVESSDDAIFSTSPEGAIDTWNAGSKQLYGYSEPEALGRSVAVLLPDERVSDLPRLPARPGAGALGPAA
jgi:PAS domain-containing protein